MLYAAVALQGPVKSPSAYMQAAPSKAPSVAATSGSAAAEREATNQRPTSPAKTDTAPANVQITGPDGKPLPPEVEAEIRKAMQAQGDHAPKVTGADVGEHDILVSGIRQRGSVRGNVAPERVFEAADLKAFGANDVGSLLDSLAPQGLGRNDGGGTAVLINGRRASSIAEIASYPADAIERVEVLPEAAALSYGFAAGQKLINVITFARYRQTSLEGRVGTPTRGGAPNYDLTTQLFRVDGDRRFNLVAKVRDQPALQYGQRGFDALPGRTLLPHSRTQSIRPSIAGDWGSTAYSSDLQYDRNDSQSLLGPGAAGPLALRTTDQITQGGVKLDRRIGQFSYSVLSRLRLDNDRTDLFDPANGTMGRTSYREWGANVELLANGALFPLATGQAYGSARVLVAHEGALSDVSSFGQSLSHGRTRAALLLSLDLPIAGLPSSCGGAIGCLVGHVSAQETLRTDGQSILDYNGGFNWTPSRALNASVTFAKEKALPPLRLLAQPAFRSPGALVYDAVSDGIASVDIVSGGAPDLRTAATWRLTQEIFYRPLVNVDLVISSSFSHSQTHQPIINIASASALLQAAYPERFKRDNAGRLSAIDSSPVNAADSTSTSLRLGLSLSRPLGGSAHKERVITRSIPAGGNIASALPPGAVVIMAEEGSATDKALTSSESRVYLAVNYTLRLRDKISLPNGTVLDLHDGSIDGSLGLSRSEVEVQAGFYRKGVGAVLNGTFEDARVARSAMTEIVGTTEGTRVAPAVILALKLFSNLEELSSNPVFTNARVSVAVDNVFDSVQPMAFAGGLRQGQGLPFLLHPLGRVISIDLRKAW